jgi:hypothetical protein
MSSTPMEIDTTPVVSVSVHLDDLVFHHFCDSAPRARPGPWPARLSPRILSAPPIFQRPHTFPRSRLLLVIFLLLCLELPPLANLVFSLVLHAVERCVVRAAVALEGACRLRMVRPCLSVYNLCASVAARNKLTFSGCSMNRRHGQRGESMPCLKLHGPRGGV